MAGPGWHIGKERTDWPDYLKAKPSPDSKKFAEPQGKSTDKGPMVFKGKKYRHLLDDPSPKIKKQNENPPQ